MKNFALAAACLTLAGCMTPAAPTPGAVPFAQVLAETEGRPFECLNYEARTNTCEALTTYTALGGDRYATRTRSIFEAAGGQVDVTTALRAVGDQICFGDADYSIELVTGEADLQAELAFAQIENFVKEEGKGCLVITRQGTDYVARFISGSEFLMQTEPQNLRFFATPKRLRAPAL